MSKARDLIKGLRSTQAGEVFVPYETVCDVVGQEIADELVMQMAGFSQTPYNPKMPSKEAIEKAEMRKPHHLGMYDREDLLAVIDELIEEAGSLDDLLQEVEDRRSPLQKVRDSIGPSIPFPRKEEQEEVE